MVPCEECQWGQQLFSGWLMLAPNATQFRYCCIILHYGRVELQQNL